MHNILKDENFYVLDKRDNSWSWFDSWDSLVREMGGNRYISHNDNDVESTYYFKATTEGLMRVDRFEHLPYIVYDSMERVIHKDTIDERYNDPTFDKSYPRKKRRYDPIMSHGEYKGNVALYRSHISLPKKTISKLAYTQR